MTSSTHTLSKSTPSFQKPTEARDILEAAINDSWKKIAPSWPLKNFVTVNPLSGFEHLPFENALDEAKLYFQQKDLPPEMLEVNRQSIKWFEAYFDQGQATLSIPLKSLGLLKSVLALLPHDREMSWNLPHKRYWFDSLPQDEHAMMLTCLIYLGIPENEYELFLSLLLTTLPGWASYVQYLTSWENQQNKTAVSKRQYLLLRLVFACLTWPEAHKLVAWHLKAKEKIASKTSNKLYTKILSHEKTFRKQLFEKLKQSKPKKNKDKKIKAQMVFCMDVRSEPFRKALEAQGNYETFGFAGFFGLPVTLENSFTKESHASCPVLLKPVHRVFQSIKHNSGGVTFVRGLKRVYQSLKYTFTTPLSLAEALGAWSGLWMFIKSFIPQSLSFFQSLGSSKGKFSIHTLPFSDQLNYALNALKMMGMTSHFAPLVVFCGHGSSTQNNPYASALNCGACGGHHGGPNARMLADILNTTRIRQALEGKGIIIPQNTYFLGAEHNTTTDEVQLYHACLPNTYQHQLENLKIDLKQAKEENNLWRGKQLGLKPHQVKKSLDIRSQDWSQVRPEWGLAKNAALIIGPRECTQDLFLEGRAFLHSYNWREDPHASALDTLLNAPAVLAQWINSQYLFSTLDNVAFGAGSKVTQNITGKIGMMQGNASDLMTGLSLQSVYQSDQKPYHQPVRLSLVIYAPQSHIDTVVKASSDTLMKLIKNEWMFVSCFDPEQNKLFHLAKDLTWSEE